MLNWRGFGASGASATSAAFSIFIPFRPPVAEALETTGFYLFFKFFLSLYAIDKFGKLSYSLFIKASFFFLSHP